MTAKIQKAKRNRFRPFPERLRSRVGKAILSGAGTDFDIREIADELRIDYEDLLNDQAEMESLWEDAATIYQTGDLVTHPDHGIVRITVPISEEKLREKSKESAIIRKEMAVRAIDEAADTLKKRINKDGFLVVDGAQ